MRASYTKVRFGGLGVALPTRVVTCDQIESRLAPLYERLGLHPGRLELMTGIRERLFWPEDVPPSQLSINSCQPALQVAEQAKQRAVGQRFAGRCHGAQSANPLRRRFNRS